MAGKFEDWLRSETRKRLRGLNAANSGFNTQPQLKDVELITFINGNKTRGKTSSGIEVNTIAKGGVGASGMGYRQPDNSYVVIGQYRKIKSISNTISAYEIQTKTVDGTQRYFIWRLGDSPDKLYSIDVEAILGFSLPFESPCQVLFSDDFNHLYVHWSNYDINSVTTEIKYSFALNWQLGTVEGQNVVTWTSLIHKTYTLDLSQFVAEVDPPGLPPDIVVDGTNALRFPAGDFTYIYWEEETDPLIPVDPFVFFLGSLVPTNIYVDTQGLPHVDLIGAVRIEVTKYTNFRPAAMYNREAYDSDDNPIHVSSDYPPGVCPITYGSILFDTPTGQYYREVFIPSFGRNAQNTILAPLPYDYNGYLVGGDSVMGLPAGNDPDGIGNIYHNNVFAFSLFSKFDATGGGFPNFYDGHGVKIENLPTEDWWNESADDLTPPDTYTGIFTQFMSTVPVDSAPGWIMPDWNNDSDPPGPDVWYTDPIFGPQFRLYGTPTVMPVIFTWANFSSKNVNIVIIDGDSVQFSPQRAHDFERGEIQISDPTYGLFVDVFTNPDVESGTNWAIGGLFSQSAYKRIDSEGGVHIVTCKSDLDNQEYVASIPIGPSQYIKNNDYFSIASDHEVPAGQFISMMTDEICFIDWYYII